MLEAKKLDAPRAAGLAIQLFKSGEVCNIDALIRGPKDRFTPNYLNGLSSCKSDSVLSISKKAPQEGILKFQTITQCAQITDAVSAVQLHGPR